MAIEFRVLGSLEVASGATRLHLGGARQRRLLTALLLHRGRAVDKARLVDIVWAGDPPSGADVTLRSYVARLRRALAGAADIRAEPPGYVLDIGPSPVDSDRFEALARTGHDCADADPARALALFEEALALWRGRA